MPRRAQQKSAESSLLRSGRIDGPQSQQARKESLCQVFRVRRLPGAAADECINRIPICFAQPFQRLAGVHTLALRGHNYAPLRSRKTLDTVVRCAWHETLPIPGIQVLPPKVTPAEKTVTENAR